MLVSLHLETTQTRLFSPSYNNIKNYFFPKSYKPSNKNLSQLHFSPFWLHLFHLCCSSFNSNYYALNREENLRKLPRTISQETTNVLMSETFINLLQEKRAKKFGGKRGRGKKIPSGTAVNDEIPQEKQQPGPSRIRNNLDKSSNGESSNEEESGGTTCRICQIPRIELMEKCGYWVQFDICDEYIYPKCNGRSHFRR